MSSETVKYLKRNGPSLASRIASHFRSEGVSYAAARKRIQRAKSLEGVSTLYAINFPHNDSFLYLTEQYNRSEFWEALIKAFDDTNSTYSKIIHSLMARGGTELRGRIALFSGSPSRLRGHIGAEVVLEKLVKVGLLEVRSSEDFGEYICVTEKAALYRDNELGWLRARLIAEEVLLRGLGDWVRKLGLVSYYKVAISFANSSDELPSFGVFDWNLTAPSYAHPFVRIGGEKPLPGFFVADTIIGSGNVTPEQAQYFVQKCDIMRNISATRPFMGMLVASGFAPETLSLGKSKGLLFTTPENIFGDQVAEALKLLLATLVKAAEVAVERPERISQIFENLARIEGAAQSLRGPLFEMIAAHCIAEGEKLWVEIGRKIRDPKMQEAEIDVLGLDKRKRVFAIECKARRPGGYVDVDVVQDWLRRQVPRIRGWFNSQDDYRYPAEHHFEIWTNGTFSHQALELLRTQKKQIGKYSVDFRDGSEVLEYAKSIGAKHIVDTLNEHFMQSSTVEYLN